MKKEELEKNLRTIDDAIKIKVDPLIISQCNNKLQDLSVLFSLSAECMKWAKKYRLDKQGIFIEHLYKSGEYSELSASILSKLIESKCAEEEALLMWCDRLNAAITHTCENLRTTISLYKQEMMVSAMGGGGG